MTIEDQISALLVKAEPLRLLPETEQGELGAIVDRINALRALQAAGVDRQLADSNALISAPSFVAEEVKRGPGRPKKAQA